MPLITFDNKLNMINRLKKHWLLSRQNCSLFVGHHDDEDGRDAAEDDDNGQGQERSLRVAHSLGCLLHAGHNVRGADLQDPAALAQIRLELLIDFQHVAIEKSVSRQQQENGTDPKTSALKGLKVQFVGVDVCVNRQTSASQQHIYSGEQIALSCFLWHFCSFGEQTEDNVVFKVL